MSVYSTFRHFLTVFLAIMITSAACGATITWTGAGADDNWSTMANWDSAVGLDNEIIFDTSIGGNVNVDVSPMVSSIEFDNTGAELYTLDINNTLSLQTELITNSAAGITQTITGDGALTSESSLTIAGDGDLNIEADITGSNPLTKNGSGTLHLAAANSLTGAVTLNDGTFSIADNLSIGSGDLTISGGTLFGSLTGDEITNGDVRTLDNAVTLSGDATFDNTADGAMALTGDVDLDAGTRDINVAANGDVTLSGVISNGGLSKSGNGTLTLSAANTYADGTTLDAGTLEITNNDALGDGAITLNGGVLFGVASDPVPVPTLDNALTIGGDVGLAGSLQIDGTVDLSGATRDIDVAEGIITLNGVISNGGLSKSGASVLFINGVNTYADGTTFNEGFIVINDQQSLGDGDLTFDGGKIGVTSDNADFVLDNNVILLDGLVYQADGQAATLSTLTLSGPVALDGNTAITVEKVGTGENDKLIISGDIDDAGAVNGLAKSGAGTLEMAGTNTYTGATVVDEGVLQLTSGSAIEDTSELQVNGGRAEIVESETIGTLAGSGGTVSIADEKTLTVAGDDDGTFEGTLTGAGDLDKTGNGLLGLHGAGTLTGDVTVGGGTLSVGHDDALGTGELNLADGTALYGSLTQDQIDDGDSRTIANHVNVTGNITVDNIVDGSMNISGDIDLGGQTRTVTVEADGNATWSGAVIDGGLVKQGDGILILSGDNSGGSFSNGVTLDAGTLGFGHSNAIAENVLIINGGQLHGEGEIALVTAGAEITVNDDFGISSTADGFLTLADDINLTGATRTITLDADSTATFEGVISNGGVIIDGDGTVTFSGDNTYADGTTLDGSTLIITGADAIGDGALTFNGGGIGIQSETDITLDNDIVIDGDFSFESSETTVGDDTVTPSLAFDAAATLNADSTITVALVGDGIDDRLIFNDTIDDGGGNFKVTKDGDGTLVFNAANTIGGGVDINSGTLVVTDDGGLGSGDVTLYDAAILQASGRTLNNNIIIDTDATGTLSGTDSTTILNGTVSGLNADALFNIANSDTGSTPDLFEVTTAAGDQLADDLNINLDADTQLTLGGADAIGSISGAGELDLGDQNLSLNSGTGNFTGTLTDVNDIEVNGGEHAIASNATFGETVNGADALKVNAGEITLSGDNTITGNINIAAGTTATLSGDNTITDGDIQVDGTLYAATDALGGETPILANGATLGAADDTGLATAIDIGGIAADQGIIVDTVNGNTTITGLTFVDNFVIDQTGDNLFSLEDVSSTDANGDQTLTINSGTTELTGTITLNDNDTITANAGGRVVINGGFGNPAMEAQVSAGAGELFYGESASVTTYNLDEQTGLFANEGQTNSVDEDVNLLGDTTITGGGTVDFEAGNALNLNGADRNLTVEENATLLINSQITGAETLTKTGDGVMSIATDQTTFTGTLAVDQGTLDLAATVDNDVTATGGTLQLSVDDAVVAGNTLTVGDATVKAAGGDRTVAADTVFNGDVTIVGDTTFPTDDSTPTEETITFNGDLDLDDAAATRALTVDETAAVVIAGDISNGTLDLAGDGVTTINGAIGGDLAISGDGDNVINGDIADGFDLDITGDGDNTFDGTVVNGDVTIDGDGDNAFTGDLTTGDMFISGHGNNTVSGNLGGNLLMSGNGQNEVSGSVTGNLTVDTNGVDAVTTLSGNVASNVIVNDGDLRLTDTGSLTGILTLNGGGIQAQTAGGNGHTLANDVTVNGSFDVKGTEQLILSGATSLDADATIALTDEASFAIRNLDGNNALTIDTAGGRFELGDEDDADFDMTAFRGDVNITGSNDGQARINAEIGDGVGDIDITVTGTAAADRAVLMGIGTINGNVTIDSFGTHNPGNSVGTQTINGDYTLAAGGRLLVEIDTDLEDWDRVNVTNGDVTVQADSEIEIQVIGTGVLLDGQFFRIIETPDGTVTELGAGATIIEDSDFYDFDGGVAVGNQSYLIQADVLNDFVSLARGVNNASVGRALNQMIGTGDEDKQDMLVALQAMNADDYNYANEQLNTSPYIVAQQTAKRLSNADNAYLTSRLEARRTGLDGLLAMQNNLGNNGPMLFASAAIDPMMFKLALDDQANRQIADRYRVSGGYPTASPFDWQLYGRFYGGFDRQDTRDDYPGFDGDTTGFMVGLDKQIKRDAIFGVSFNYDKTDITFDEGRGTAKIDTLRAGPYWSWEYDRSFFDLTTSFGYHSTDMNRIVTVGDLDPYTPTSSYDAFDVTLYGGTGLVYKVEHWWMLPTLSFQYQYFNQGSATEQDGGAANLDVDNWSSHSLQSHLGFRANRIFEVDDLTIVPELGVGWRHEFITPEGIHSNFTGESTTMSFVAEGDATDALTYSAALSALVNENTTFFLRFDGEFHQDGSTNVVSAGFTFRK